MKKILFVIILIIIMIVISVKLFSNEDDWICVDGEWIKHGNPSAPKPTLPCGTIDSFEECVAAGHPVMESYPRQCKANEQTFVEEIYKEIYGTVSLKGELFCPCFLVDGVEVWYDLMQEKPAVDVSDINNGDFVVVRGELQENQLFWAEEIFKATKCKPEDRNMDACIEIYQPVCGMPINQTFGNSCFACINESVIYYTEGECT